MMSQLRIVFLWASVSVSPMWAMEASPKQLSEAAPSSTAEPDLKQIFNEYNPNDSYYFAHCLQHILSSPQSESNYNLVTALIMCGAQINKTKHCIDLLPLSCSGQNFEVARLLLQHKADPDGHIGTNARLSPLNIIARADKNPKSIECVRLLLEHQADPCAHDGGRQLRSIITLSGYANSHLKKLLEEALAKREHEIQQQSAAAPSGS